MNRAPANPVPATITWIAGWVLGVVLIVGAVRVLVALVGSAVAVMTP